MSETGPAGAANTSPVSKPSRIRHVIVFIAALMSVLLYLDRFCVSFAADYIREDLQLTQSQMGWFLSAFFWSYALAQVPAGYLSDRYGARIMLAIYVLSWSFFTGMVGAVHSFALLLLTRLACGLGQAGAYPTSASVVSKWVPFSQRGTASAVVSFGGRIGGAIAPLLTAYLIVMFVPMGTPVEFSATTLHNSGRLAARLSPLPANDPPDEPAKATGKMSSKTTGKLTKPSPAGSRIAGLLPAETQQSVAQAASEFRRLEQERNELSDKAKTTTDAQAKQTIKQSLANLEEQLAAHEAPQKTRDALANELNKLLSQVDIYNNTDFKSVNLPKEAVSYLKRLDAGEQLEDREIRRFNRLLIEATFPAEIGKLYTSGWRPVMFIYGFIGVFVAGLLWICFRNRPEEHPWCNTAEQELITQGRPAGAPSPHGKPGKIPIGPLLRSRSMWFDCFSQVGTNIGWVFLVTWLPRYLIEVHNVPILERGVMASVPLVVGFVGMLAGGLVTDAMVPKVGLKWGRRFPLMFTRFMAAAGYLACLIFATSGESWLNSPWMFVAAFSLVAFSTDMGAPATWAFKQDVGGRYVGSILGWGNMWGNLGAACSPLIYDLVLGETPTIANWNTMFAVCMGAFIFAGLCAFGVDATIPIAPADDEH